MSTAKSATGGHRLCRRDPGRARLADGRRGDVLRHNHGPGCALPNRRTSGVRAWVALPGAACLQRWSQWSVTVGQRLRGQRSGTEESSKPAQRRLVRSVPATAEASVISSPPRHAAQNGWASSASSWLGKRAVIDTLISPGAATAANPNIPKRGSGQYQPELSTAAR